MMIFSSENRFIKMQQNYNPDSKQKQPPNKSSSNNMEYNPLAGVSFKQNHTSDVEIVGVKLGSQNGQDTAIAQKKKNSLKSKPFVLINSKICQN
jgi:hypothetical protein